LLLVTFATVFSISTFVVGPAITESDEPPVQPVRDADDHDAHH
jgi:hypothetical protein